MGLTYRQHESGLLLAEGETAIAEALWEYDRNLKLRSSKDAAGREWWSVRAHVGGDVPDRFVCAWIDEAGNPLPLSSGILDLVKQLDPNTRSVYLDEDAREQQRREETEKTADQRAEDLIDDHIWKHGRPVLPRSVSLRMARDKRRARGENV